MTKLIFLGCGGGRHQTIDQKFGTGGFRIHENQKLHVDPGPGSILLSRQLDLDPRNLDSVIVTHAHPDHYADAEILVEAMNQSKKSNSKALIGSETVFQEKEDLGPAISKYHQRKSGLTVPMKQNDTFDLNGMKINSTPTKHTDPTGIGLTIQTESGVIGYSGDTEYFDELLDGFEDARVLILNVTRPGKKRIPGHLCSEDAIKILEEVEPELCVMLHMGMLFLRESPKEQSNWIESESGVNTIPGYIGTEVNMNEKIEVKRPSKQFKVDRFY
ncbi:MAG: MBL fold metallo-hydrolase [Hadesarchaea archaeon]|nr:MBL fold metallo-hydrolase [Hadesarchaea archaeon]